MAKVRRLSRMSFSRSDWISGAMLTPLVWLACSRSAIFASSSTSGSRKSKGLLMERRSLGGRLKSQPVGVEGGHGPPGQTVRVREFLDDGDASRPGILERG